nr:hypothetical protein [Actinoplanes flavus]
MPHGRSGGHGGGPHPAEQEHRRSCRDDGGDVGGEQQRGLACVVVAVDLQEQSDHGQWRHQRDGDGDAGQGIRYVGTDQGERSYGAGGQCCEQVDEARTDPRRDLTVGGEQVGRGGDDGNEVGDQDDRGAAGHDEQGAA